jgi:hypothetical protein
MEDKDLARSLRSEAEQSHSVRMARFLNRVLRRKYTGATESLFVINLL